ncbi:N-acetylglutamate synthase [Bacillus sp. M6-12]|uniref:bifunctional ornithine acetyltransferase/N-acetylglutamate synthase n=1 Tax=Bacillus sp. M6-12 TaxID=2054166 RepID=UPI000C7941F4|nr:bifunctional ornithine acetyltransferase/N-acetylglutamate synthase [Bacillus sp. M6-12]PLS15487.1 N-acetylglutamate synthase [Bacillus sp. M6-12]
MKTLNPVESIQHIQAGNILSPEGYSAAGVHAGLRYSKKDMGAVLSEVPASCAAVYTLNTFQAAPLAVTRESISQEGKIQAVIVNSACANACTGEQGLADAYEMREAAAQKFTIPNHYVAVASTGVIGEYMQMDKIKQGIQAMVPNNDVSSANDFEVAILTTDTVTKNCGYEAEIDNKKIKMGGAAKGSGMIHPNMATMLGFITTDASIETADLQAALSSVTDETFNQITVDGDTSTNDMVLVMANGKAGNKPLNAEHPDWAVFLTLLRTTCEDLAKQIAKDGEGATKLIEVKVQGMGTQKEARQIAKTIIGSNLVKTAVYGSDANWGRIIGAMGRSEVAFNPDKVSISFGNICLLDHGRPIAFSEKDAKAYLDQDNIVINVFLEEGKEEGIAWGCDLTYDYVKINASYRT